MDLNPHDLLEIKCISDLISYSPLPDWVESSLNQAPFVVVRRARAEEGLVSVGIRGEKRNERFAAFLPIKQIQKQITPEQLAASENWKGSAKELFRHMDEVSLLMKKHSLTWGPTGSVGFELASRKETVTEMSDLDLLIRADGRFTQDFCRTINYDLKKVPIAIDVQVELPEGAFSLHEIVTTQEEKIVLRTMNGPMLRRIYLELK
ncbi:malonate decarboxylase holo-ACP synthase [Sporosarcina obsidiansis]|uniref:malonate decarboxylase holo-ACP synthase n=1 Tax=Sporosarcina obsidiansis TaxID=2660748 RepID=UPI00129C0E7E|nr:malonate decarboxylase holo-ACP synthase [Sporosarcina obsidiansis]